MADPKPVNVTVIVTVAVTDPDPDNRTATFTYSGIGVNENEQGQWSITAGTDVVTLYEFTPARDSQWTPAPFTPMPPVDWIWLFDQNWTVTIDGTNVEPVPGGPAGFRVSVVLGGVTYVGDPTIIMVDPPPPPPYR